MSSGLPFFFDINFIHQPTHSSSTTDWTPLFTNNIILLFFLGSKARRITAVTTRNDNIRSSMRSLIFGILAFMAAISTAVTYDIPKQPFPEESPPFKLVLLSSNSSLDGMTLFACRQVILTDSLCTVNSRDMPHMGRPVPDTPRVTTFHLNYTTEPEATHQQVSPDLGVEGILTRHYANYYTDWMPASMRLGYTRAGHAVTLFRGGQERATVVGFDKEDKLFLWGRDDGSLMPQHEVTEDECYTAVYHWYVCMTKWMTEFETVVWSSGDKPDDPTCQKVDIKRVFI